MGFCTGALLCKLIQSGMEVPEHQLVLILQMGFLVELHHLLD